MSEVGRTRQRPEHSALRPLGHPDIPQDVLFYFVDYLTT